MVNVFEIEFREKILGFHEINTSFNKIYHKKNGIQNFKNNEMLHLVEFMQFGVTLIAFVHPVNLLY